MTEPFETLVARLADRLVSGGLRLAAAESCTGGWVAKVCTDAAGSSRWFERGFVTYSNEAKEELLGVRADTLARLGAVSEATVREMAAGALRHSRADVALAISGIAGPGGGSADKPVGTVWFAWAWRDGRVAVRCERFGGDRDAVRRAAVATALGGLLDGVGG
jgi:nicotinamide-nucleotide amidase